MKRILILRHVNWDDENFTLTDRGKEMCSVLRNRLESTNEKFEIVIASPSECDIQTAQLLSGKKPIIDKRADKIRGAERKRFVKEMQAMRHPHLHIESKYIEPQFIVPIRKAGENLLELVKEVLLSLSPGSQGLIITHSQNMLAMEMILKDKILTEGKKNYEELEGYLVNEQLQLEEWSW